MSDKNYPLPDKEIQCPYTGFKKSCREIVSKHTCPKYMNLKGKNPQTNEDMDQWACSDTLLPFIHLQTDMRAFQLLAATEELRNEIFKQDSQIIRTLQIAAQEKKKENNLLEAQNKAIEEVRKQAPKLIKGVEHDEE